jgi:sugar phosphate isomerase/epimerase
MSDTTTQMATVTTQAILESGTAGYSRERPMSPASTPLTPSLALDYLRELSADIRAGVVLDPSGALLAGPEDLADPARDLMAAAGDAREVHVANADGNVFGARSDRHTLVVVCGRFALPSLIRYDLRRVLADLAGVRPEAA